MTSEDQIKAVLAKHIKPWEMDGFPCVTGITEAAAEIAALASTAGAGAGGWVTVRTDPFRCPECGCHSYARVSERKADGSFSDGPLVRCVECKSVFRDPAVPASPRSGAGEEAVEAAAATYYDSMMGQVPHTEGWAGKPEEFKTKVRERMALALAAASQASALSQGGGAGRSERAVEIRELSEKATQGKWLAREYDISSEPGLSIIESTLGPDVAESLREEDAAFIEALVKDYRSGELVHRSEIVGRSEKGEGDGPRRLPFNMDQRAQAAVLADLPPSVAQEAGEHYENAGAPHPKQIKKRDAMAVAWASVLRPYLIGLRDQYDAQARPSAPAQSPSTSDREG